MLLMRTAYTSLLIVKTLYTCTVCGQSTNSLQTVYKHLLYVNNPNIILCAQS